MAYLDAVTPTTNAHAYKRLTFALQEIEAGDRLLDLGCGTGDDARAMATAVRSSGRILGVDRSKAMIAEARRRTSSSLPIEFRVGDVYELESPDESFDGCRADRVFQHLAAPRAALAELLRVCRPGRRVVVADPDWGLVAIDAEDRALTRRLLDFLCDEYANGWAAHQTPGLFRELGVDKVSVTPVTVVLRTLAEAEQLLQLMNLLERALAAEAVAPDDALAWLGNLRRTEDANRFFLAFTGFIVAGEKP
jgi:ubiquinone/menaquinone biosynthesis C-methylase UbiE